MKIVKPILRLLVSVGPALMVVAGIHADDKPTAATYRSPYSVRFHYPVAELLGDIDGPRGHPEIESSIPANEWYARRIREKFGSWGPPARHYPPPPGVADKSVEWKRERVVAVGLRFLGYGYQHHHVPDWNPPADWPWSKTAVGHNGKGVDCSNFTAFVYNLSFGLKPTGNIHNQAKELEIPGAGRDVRAERIKLPDSYKERLKVMNTGDLLYIRSRAGEISHVVIWIGSIGVAPDGQPLILDSHGQGVKDANGDSIPCGIQLRPFRENSWYNKSASHAHRIFRRG